MNGENSSPKRQNRSKIVKFFSKSEKNAKIRFRKQSSGNKAPHLQKHSPMKIALEVRRFHSTKISLQVCRFRPDRFINRRMEHMQAASNWHRVKIQKRQLSKPLLRMRLREMPHHQVMKNNSCNLRQLLFLV